MAFKDNPTSDKYAKNSEESVNAFKFQVTQKRGFITRSVSPDFGVDENIELLYYNGKEYSGASNKHFAAQLKSIDKVNPYINKGDKDYIKLQFETSRLGYLLRNQPAFGIIVVYDKRKETLYYEYAEKIYNYLKDIHNGDSWMEKKLVTIYISIENVLNSESVKEIHTKMFQRHQNASLCFNAFGSDYGINTYVDEITDGKLDFNNPKEIINQLNINGWKLIYSNDFSILLEMLERILQKDILSSSSLIAIAATSFCESGQFIESKFYLQKYTQKFDNTDEFYDSMQFIKYKVEFALGNLDYNGYSELLDKISKKIKGDYNQIIVKINLLYIKLINDTTNRKCNEETIFDIMSIVENIKNSTLAEKSKFYLSAYNNINIQVYYINYITSLVGNFKLRNDINEPIFNLEVAQFIQKKDLIEKLIKSTLANIYIYADKNEDNFLKAKCLQDTSNFFFIKNLNALMMNEEFLLPLESNEELFETKINQAFSASSLYEGIARYKDAYSSICIAYELTAFYFHTYGVVILNELFVINSIIKEFATKYGFEPYKSQVDDYYLKSSIELILTEELIKQYADLILEQLKLPQDRKINIISDLRTIEVFKLTDQSKDFNLLQDLRHKKSVDSYFKEPCTYIIQCKKCGENSESSQDINTILSFLSSHYCLSER